jgi:hypothetical protein
MSDTVPKRTRQEMWEEYYRSNPYLRGKPESHLIERFGYLVHNLVSATESKQLGLVTERRMIEWLMSRLTHMFMEFSARGGIPAHAREKIRLPNLAESRAPAGARAYNSRARKEPGQAFKFGKLHWLQRMLGTGEIRFLPASAYSDPSLNQAIRDDELTFTYFPAKSSPALKGLPRVLGADWMRQRHPSDYYVQCFSCAFALRLFDDFEADACLIVYDGREFARRVVGALTKKFPGWISAGISITYIDPDDPGDGEIVIPAVKHMKYFYQQEQRFISHPRTSIARLDPITIEIGSLSDIAELIHL